MAIDKIDKKLSNIPLLRKRITVNPTIQADKDDFMDKYETTNDHLSNKTVGELNQIVDAIDNTTTQIDETVTTINTQTETVITKANEASESATSASTSASEAEEYKNQAESAVASLPEGALNDSTTGLTTTWSSQKISNELSSLDADNIVHKSANLSDLENTATARTNLGLGTAATRDVGTASGDVMEVGAFGLGGRQYIANYDFDASDIGYTQFISLGDGATGTVPMGTTRGGAVLNIVESPTITSKQLFFGYSDNVIAYRSRGSYNNRNWNSWVELHHTGNILNTTGQSTKYPMTQKAVTDALVTEKVYNLTGTQINPANGTIQYKTISANTTFTETLTSGQSALLRLINASSYTITFPSITWVTATAPILTANCVIVLWKEQTTLYGAYVGSLV